MHKERLEKVVELLREIDPEDFDLTVWTGGCGTAGCAVGHACMSPWFKKEGLSIETALIAIPTPRYENHNGWAAVVSFFEVSPEEAMRDFDENWRNQKLIREDQSK